MSDPLTRFFNTAASRMWLWRYRAKWRAKRVLKAWRFIVDRMSADDARSIMLDCERPAGWHPLLILTVEDTLEQARATLADDPALPRLIAYGCVHVSAQWESLNDDLYEARRRAIEVAERYAVNEGIALVHLNEEAIQAEGELTSDVVEEGAP
jgi:hypothetical protein